MVGKRLKEVRLKLGLTQEEFTEKLGIPLSKPSKIETGRQDVDSGLLNGLSGQFGVDIHWLVTGEGAMFARMSGRSGGGAVGGVESPKDAKIIGLLEDKVAMQKAEIERLKKQLRAVGAAEDVPEVREANG